MQDLFLLLPCEWLRIKNEMSELLDSLALIEWPTI